MHGHQQGVALLAWAVVAGVPVVVGAYLAAASRLRRRGDGWPRSRDGCFPLGCLAVLAVVLTPERTSEFTGHVARHLVIGMAAPLLIVLARPLTLALRAMSAGGPSRRPSLPVTYGTARC